jgi:hypothetical protein
MPGCFGLSEPHHGQSTPDERLLNRFPCANIHEFYRLGLLAEGTAGTSKSARAGAWPVSARLEKF